MFMKSIHKIIIILLFAAAIAGCKKSFLDRPSNSKISSNNFYKTTSDLRLATASLYGGGEWWQWNNGMLPLGDVLAGTGSFGIVTIWYSFLHAPLPRKIVM
jgi:hypothetical protein